MKKMFIIAVTLLLLYGITEFNVNATEIRPDTETSDHEVISEDSVLFDYSVDSVSVFTNDSFNDYYDGEKYQFYPENNGKYIIVTCKYNMDIIEVLKEPSLDGVVSTVQCYIVSMVDGEIIVDIDEDTKELTIDSSDTEKAWKDYEPVLSLADREIGTDYYFEHIKPRVEDKAMSYCQLYINSSYGRISVTKDYESDSYTRELSYQAINEENIKRYIVGSSKDLFTYSDVNGIQKIHIYKTEKGIVTVYDVDEANGTIDMSTLKISSFKEGDVNGDGEFNVADLILLQKWLLGSADAGLKNWKAADFCNDNVLNVFDLCLVREALIYK